jgi:hypothetical protein
MPKKLRPFQRELKEREDDRARIERELKLRQRIYRFAELSEKNANVVSLFSSQRSNDSTYKTSVTTESWIAIPALTPKQQFTEVQLNQRRTR